MSLRLSVYPEQLARLKREVGRARLREIGGVFVGEHLGGDDFALVDFSVQRYGGGCAHFERDPVAAACFVDAAIERAGGDPSRVNYLGEWHSHPAMSASPSVTDVAQMQAIVEEPEGVATFSVLIVASERSCGLAMSATLFRRGQNPEPALIVIDGAPEGWVQASSDPVDEEDQARGRHGRRSTSMGTLKDRFNDKAVVEAMLRQRLVRGDRDLAERFVAKGRLGDYVAGDLLIEQGNWDTDLYFILAGEFEVIINGQHKATRGPGIHVGELAGLNPARARTATLRAVGDALVLTVSAADVDEVAGGDAEFWKAAADVAAERLDQRNAEIGIANEQPRVFVISSSEGIEVTRIVRQELDSDKIHVHVWHRGTFSVSDYAMSSLEEAIEAADFAIAVVRADDALVARNKEAKVARDNVHLEYGMAVGKLGLKRAFLLVDASEDVKLPSDLAGLTTLRYRSGNKDEMGRTVAKACDSAREQMGYIGVRRDRRAS